MGDWEVVIGLEVHCQLATQTKIFSGAPTAFGQEPNTQVATVDLGLPGVLPVLNREVPELAIKAGLALGCSINLTNQFARKNYFYPDLPKGYQISQHTLPICEHGALEIETENGKKTIGVTRIHMEEDAGKSTHISGAPHSIVDLNRAGVPLIEIVSEPDMRSADEAIAYLKELRAIVRYLGVCDGNMEQGSFRCDANVSVRRPGEPLGTRCELKNINSFKFVRDAIQYEVRRQIELIEDGDAVVQQTRLYNPDKGITFAMRSKEDAHDYRYFPDPDLPLLQIDQEWLDRLRSEQPELPSEKRSRYQSELGLSEYDAGVLAADREVADYFEASLVAFDGNPKVTANWVINEVLREADANSISDLVCTAGYLAQIVSMLEKEEINGKIAKTVFAKTLESGDAPEAIVENEGLRQVTDTGAIESAIDDVIAQNPDNVAQFRSGKEQLIGWFVGQVMRATQGKANPKIVNELLREKLRDPK